MLNKIKDIFNRTNQSIEGNNNIQAAGGVTIINSDDIPSQIDHSKYLLDNLKPESALEFLEKLRARVWNKGSVTNIDKFRILNNIGSAKNMMGLFQEASPYFVEAFMFNGEDEKALSNVATAYLMLGQPEKSVECAKKLFFPLEN